MLSLSAEVMPGFVLQGSPGKTRRHPPFLGKSLVLSATKEHG